MQNVLAAIQMLDELGNAAAVVELVALDGILAFVGQRDLEALVQERQFAQPLRQRVEVECARIHDGGVRLERDLRAGLVAGLARPLQWAFRDAARVLLLPGCLVAPDLELQALGQRVHAAHADAVQSARDLVAVRIELAAGVQLRHHHLRRRDAFLGVNVDRNAAAVVHDRDRIVDVNRYFNLGRMTSQRLVNGVVDHLVDQVVQPGFAGRTDVHGRTKPNGLESFEHFDTAGIVNTHCCHIFTCHR